MDQDYCQRIKCGVIPQSSVPMGDLLACSQEYGAGAFGFCHADCVQYGKCQQAMNLPIPLSALPTTQALVQREKNPYYPQPLLYSDVIPPIPSIVAMQVPLVIVPESMTCCGPWDSINTKINENPFWALMALGLATWIAGKK